MTEEKRKELESKLWQLHAELTGYFLDELKKEGGASASMMASIATFLKNNGITATNKATLRYSLQSLQAQDEELELPFPSEESA